MSRPAPGGLGVEHGIDQLTSQAHGLATCGAVGEDHSPDPVLTSDPQAGKESEHRSAVPGKNPLPDALQVIAQPVGSGPALHVRHDQRPTHLLETVRGENLVDRICHE